MFYFNFCPKYEVDRNKFYFIMFISYEYGNYVHIIGYE